VVSPIDGVIVSGDLDRYIGSPLEIGQTLVEIAPLDRVNIEIEIPEYEIGYVVADADARIRFASIGGDSIRQKVNAVYPAAEIRDDNSVFVAKMEVENPEGKLRPGMRGDATAYGPLRPAAWSWIRGSWERLLWWAGY
jgi:multidrug efflux pump subunit AcrA (membrane-fusion protein)